MLAQVRAYLEERRVLGTSVDVQPVRLRGVQVAVDARVERFADPLRVEHEIRRALYRYVNPFGTSLAQATRKAGPSAAPSPTATCARWCTPFTASGASALLRIYECDPASRDSLPHPAGATIVIGPDELVCSGDHAVSCSRD